MRDLLNLAGEGFFPSEEIQRDVEGFLGRHQKWNTYEHSGRVADKATQFAERFSVPAGEAIAAAWLHDISAVIPNDERLSYAQSLSVEILEEEYQFPMLLHQKLSRVIAAAVFQVKQAAILEAIGCHTTLRPEATRLDKVIFVADKIAWDQNGEPPYSDAIQQGLGQSLEHACLAYLEFLWDSRDILPGPIHPWAAAARAWLRGCIQNEENG